ncbi:MAG: class I SAM-dependent methyltransferase [Helicobacteraceae bacterium]|jgi:hypothetical protein|nr:class I SAM-dependent methyltransferase [Helicobacteraceae bacterium]
MNCKICQEPAASFYDDYMKCQTYHCRACAFIFKDDEAIISTEKELKVYQQHNNTEENLGYVAMFQDFIDKTITPHKEHIMTALDFGSGPNPVLARILERDGFVTDHYDKFFSTEKAYENKRYDLITSTEVIEHISDVQSVMAFFAQHLNAGGYLALMTQFHADDEEAYLNWWYRRDPTHISFFRPHTFKILAQQHGMKCLYHDDTKLVLLQKERVF